MPFVNPNSRVIPEEESKAALISQPVYEASQPLTVSLCVPILKANVLVLLALC